MVEFEKLPNASRIWIFPSSRKFYSKELEALNNKLKTFLLNWIQPVNTQKLDCAYQLLHNRFIIIGADDTDFNLTSEMHHKLSAFILSLEKEYQGSLLDKINVCFKQGEYVQYTDIQSFQKLIKNKSVSKKTLVFDNLIQTKSDLTNHWEINIMDSWLSRFIK